jgi:hypothetical protein
VDGLGLGVKKLGFGALPRAQAAVAPKVCVVIQRKFPS